MNISDKAKAYAEGKATTALNSAIEAAYAEGYNAGFSDGLASKEGEKPDDLDDGVEYVDLGLPSGTKWLKDYLIKKDEALPTKIYLSYEEASKLNIPTEKQYEELLSHCKLEPMVKENIVIGYMFIGVNGKALNYYNGEIQMPNLTYMRKERPLFWLKAIDEDEPDSTDRPTSSMSIKYTKKLYMGYHLPVILVR